MSNGWNGVDPTPVDDGAGTVYELATQYRAEGDVTVSQVRVYHGPSSGTVVGRTATLWSNAGAVLATASLPNELPSGWSTYDLDEPVEVLDGTTFRVSYGTRQWYAATAGGYPALSGDGLLTGLSGFFVEAIGSFPTSASASFYGIDVVYAAGVGGNIAPVVSLAVVMTGLTAAATATVTDEDPGTLAYAWEWGDGTSTATVGDPTEGHTYASPGLYAVLVTVTDEGGLKDAAAVPVVARRVLAGLNLADVMDELAQVFGAVSGLNERAYPWPSPNVQPPAVVVTYPDGMDPNATYGQGMTRIPNMPVVLLIGKATERTARDKLSEFVSGDGAGSLIAAVEGNVWATADTVTVKDIGFDVVRMAGTDYLAATFLLDITGSGG